MTLPSELLGLIEALETAKADESRHVTNEERREAPLIYTNRLMALAAARTALIAGIERYGEEGQEAAAQVADEMERAMDRDKISGYAVLASRQIATNIRALRPTPPEEPKP